MATMKSYTDISQSKKLVEFLPFESADMYYINGDIDKVILRKWESDMHDEDDIPCWSLTALLDVIPGVHLKKYTYNDGTTVYYTSSLECGQANTKYYDNPVDACYDMILKLHELKML